LGVWATLTLASQLNITESKVFGDSIIVIDLLKRKGNLQVLTLDCWKERIRDLSKLFSLITFSHIYRDSNKEADPFSKKSLQMQTWKIDYNLWEDGNEGPTLFLNLY